MDFRITGNTDNDNMTANLFERAIKKAGLTLEPFDPATVPAPDFGWSTAADVADAAYQAAAAGKDPATDKEVTRLLASYQLAQVVGGGHHRHQVALSRARLAHLKDQAPALLEEATTRWDQALAAMGDARRHIRLGHGGSLGALASQPGTPADTRRAAINADEANRTCDAILEALRHLIAAAHGGFQDISQTHKLFWFITPTPEQYQRLMLNGASTTNTHDRRHNVFDLLNDGLTIELATSAKQVSERVNEFERAFDLAQRDTREDEAAQAMGRHQARTLRS